jgi:hypothetical protein
MGIYICEKHGRQGCRTTCRHLESAITNDQPLHFWAVTHDDILAPHLELCDPCHNLWSTMNASSRDSFLDTVTTVCGGCFQEWKSKHSTSEIPSAI